MFIVYILYSDSARKHYTGFTTNLTDRLTSHNQFGKDWTARYRPWRLIFHKNFDTKSEALLYEKWLKTGVGREFVKTIKK